MKNNLYRSENVVLKRNAKKNIKKHSQINKLRNTFSHRTAKKITNLQDKEKNEDNYYLTNKEVKIKQTKEKKDMPKIQYNLFYNRNINDYQMFITEYTNTHKGNLSWAIKLRANQNKNILTEPSSKKSSSKNKKTTKTKSSKSNEKTIEKPKGITLTESFNEPKFYNEDLEKYKLRIKKDKRPLSSMLNPNFNIIRHLYIDKNNFRSKEFGASLRNYSPLKKGKDKIKIKWDNYLSPNRDDKHLTKFLLPRTNDGREAMKRLEKRMYRPYKVLFKDVILGDDKIKQKVMTPVKDFTYDGIGEHLNMINYHSHYRVKNTSQAENIFKKGTNSQCLYELGLRNYKPFSAKN